MNTKQNNRQRESNIDREKEEVDTDRCMYTTQNNRQRESNIDREEEEEVGTDRSTQLRTIDREEEEVGTDRCTQHRTIEREIVRQGGGGGGRYRQMYTT